MAIARLLYHEPRYAFVDEGTSAVSSDVEGIMYEKAKARGITLVTISTRASLKRYHSFTLTLGLGEAGEEWEFQQIGTAAEKSTVEKELADLRERLSKVEFWKKRRLEIDAELNKVWVEGGNELDEPEYIKARREKQQEEADEEEGLQMMSGNKIRSGQISVNPASLLLGASQETVLSSVDSEE